MLAAVYADMFLIEVAALKDTSLILFVRAMLRSCDESLASRQLICYVVHFR